MRQYGHFEQTVTADLKTAKAGSLISDRDTKTTDRGLSIHQSFYQFIFSSIISPPNRNKQVMDAFQDKNNLMHGTWFLIFQSTALENQKKHIGNVGQ